MLSCLLALHFETTIFRGGVARALRRTTPYHQTGVEKSRVLGSSGSKPSQYVTRPTQSLGLSGTEMSRPTGKCGDALLLGGS